MPRAIEAAKLRLSVAIGHEDRAMKWPRIVRMKEIPEVKLRGEHEVVVMPGAKHGFAVRVDPTDEVQLEFAERAEDQAVEWFSRRFA